MTASEIVKEAIAERKKPESDLGMKDGKQVKELFGELVNDPEFQEFAAAGVASIIEAGSIQAAVAVALAWMIIGYNTAIAEATQDIN